MLSYVFVLLCLNTWCFLCIFTSNAACSGRYGGHPHLIGEVKDVATAIASVTQSEEAHSDWVHSSTCRAHPTGKRCT